MGLFDDDLADHAVVGVRFAVAADDAAAQIGDAAGGDRHEPPFGGLTRINLDLADRALELRERDGLAVAHLRYLNLPREDHSSEGVRREVVRIVARVAHDQLVELAGLELELARLEHVLPRLAEIDRDLDRLLAGEIAGGLR